jgi:hypothetical protein
MRTAIIRRSHVHAVLLVAGALLLGWTTCRELRPVRPPPNLRVVAESLAAERGWHVLAIPSRQRPQLFYFSERPLTPKQAAELTTHPTSRCHWAGIVMVNRELGAPVTSLYDEDWGEWGCQVGSYFIYGDPEMVSAITRAIAP